MLFGMSTNILKWFHCPNLDDFNIPICTVNFQGGVFDALNTQNIRPYEFLLLFSSATYVSLPNTQNKRNINNFTEGSKTLQTKTDPKPPPSASPSPLTHSYPPPFPLPSPPLLYHMYPSKGRVKHFRLVRSKTIRRD